jgi:hypothetical protein
VLWGWDKHRVRKKRGASILYLVDEITVLGETVPNINPNHYIEDRGINIDYHEHELFISFNGI